MLFDYENQDYYVLTLNKNNHWEQHHADELTRILR